MALKVEDGLGKEGMQVMQGHVTRALYEMIHTLIQCPSSRVVLIGAAAQTNSEGKFICLDEP